MLHVAHPGLLSHPQHELAERQFGGQDFGAPIAFALDAGHDTRDAFVDTMRLITSAVSHRGPSGGSGQVMPTG